MALQSRWAAVRFEIRAVVNGIAEFPVVQVVTSFELNAIPTISLTVAVGRNVKTQEVSASHREIERLKVRHPIEVFMRAIPLGSEGGTPNRWPDFVRIFDGYVTGTGWQRSTGGANLIIYGEHWLSELNYTSAINGASHPGNPAAFTYPAGFEAPALGGGGGTSVHWTHHLQLQGGVDAVSAESDLWENILKPWCRQVSAKQPVDLRFIGLETPVGNDGALSILEGNGEHRIVSEKMAMDLSGPDGLALGNSMARGLEKSMMNNVINTTLWGKLVGGWAGDFWFAVVPRVEDALIVPFVGALGPDQEFVTIEAGDYVQCDIHASVAQQLAAIGINHPVEWLAGGNTNAAAFDAQKGGLAAVYPTPVKKKGVIMIKNCPSWMADPVQAYLYGRAAEGVQPAEPIRTGADRDNIGPDRDPGKDPNENQKEFRDSITRYAQHWYILEQLKGRTGELSGRLRYDIAPGSQVKIEAGQDPFIEGDDLSTPFWASVSKVTNLINSEIQRAGTSFSLAHVRNRAENEDPDTSIDIPPFYKEAWQGKVLIDEFIPGA